MCLPAQDGPAAPVPGGMSHHPSGARANNKAPQTQEKICEG